jgi:hypothetical protein
MSNFKKMLIVLSASFVLFAPYSKPVQAQNVVSGEELNQLSLDEVKIVYQQYLNQYQTILANCQIGCDVIANQYVIFFNDLDTYIAQREFLEGQ